MYISLSGTYDFTGAGTRPRKVHPKAADRRMDRVNHRIDNTVETRRRISNFDTNFMVTLSRHSIS